MPRLLVIDNYDSFTYNLVQYLQMLGARCDVYFNDGIDVHAARSHAPDGVVISPGPCTPNEAGVSLELIGALAAERPILGVCLGHQAIAQAFGGKVVRAARILHGKTSPIEHDGDGEGDNYSGRRGSQEDPRSRCDASGGERLGVRVARGDHCAA
jgi:anthranilate synthase/aminodeoxychorismate synthase-like glutamine amidotransferase